MSSELGRFEKPAAEQYRGEKKLYMVPLVFAPNKLSEDYSQIYERYWSGVREHLLKLEQSMGSISRVYHEAIGRSGEEGLELIDDISEKSSSLARGKVESGATFEALEDQELVMESLDWQRCMMVGLESRRAGEYVWNAYNEATRKRYEVMAQRITQTLNPGEAGLLFLSEEHRLQFPSDVRVFYVSPPALDEIHRWMRDHRNKSEADLATE